MFANRAEAGRRLAERLGFLLDDDVVVLALPRGGVPVATEVAAAYGWPLDVILVRKLGVPSQPELAMGAIGDGEVRIINPRVVELAGVGPDELERIEGRERIELERRSLLYRGTRSPVSLEGRTALVVDDGIATGATMTAACQSARLRGARRVVVAAPVAPGDISDRLAQVADDVVILEEPFVFGAVGQFYRDFRQVDDDEVAALLKG